MIEEKWAVLFHQQCHLTHGQLEFEFCMENENKKNPKT